MKDQFDSYVNDYQGYGFDSYNRNLYNNLKSSIQNHLDTVGLLEGYIDNTILLDSITLSDYTLREQNVVTLRQRMQTFDSYFDDLNSLFNFWRGNR